MLATLPLFNPRLIHPSLKSFPEGTSRNVGKLPTPYFSMDTVKHLLILHLETDYFFLLKPLRQCFPSTHEKDPVVNWSCTNSNVMEVDYRCVFVPEMRNWKCVHTGAAGEIFRDGEFLLHFWGLWSVPNHRIYSAFGFSNILSVNWRCYPIIMLDFACCQFFKLPASTTLADLSAAGEHYCGSDWSELQVKHKGLGEKDLLKYCFSTAYIVALMHDSLGIGMSDDRYVELPSFLYHFPSPSMTILVHNVEQRQTQHSHFVSEVDPALLVPLDLSITMLVYTTISAWTQYTLTMVIKSPLSLIKRCITSYT